MGNSGAVDFGLEKAEITVDESIGGVVKVVNLIIVLRGNSLTMNRSME